MELPLRPGGGCSVRPAQLREARHAQSCLVRSSSSRHDCLLIGGILCHGRSRRTQLNQQMALKMRDAKAQQLPVPDNLDFVLSKVKQPSPEQEQAAVEIVDHFRQGKRKVNLEGVTGSGKTLVASMVIERLQPRAVLVLANNKALVRQQDAQFKRYFGDANSCAFMSDTRQFIAPVYNTKGERVEVKRGRRTTEEEVTLLRRKTLDLVKAGHSCIITSSISAIFGISPTLLGQERGLKDNEVEHIVKSLKSEVENWSDYRGRFVGRKKGEALLNRIKGDIVQLEKTRECRDMFDFYPDLMPQDSHQTLMCLMHEVYRDDWFVVVDECHHTITDLKKPAKAFRTKVGNLVRQGYLRPQLLDSLSSFDIPSSWEKTQKLLQDKRVLYMSATPPSEEDLGEKVALDLRPTHICDPVVSLRKIAPAQRIQQGRARQDSWQVIKECVGILEDRDPAYQALVAAVDCAQAEVLHAFLSVNYKCGVLHGYVPAQQKTKVLKEMEEGDLDVLVGCKTIIEGLDLPGLGTVIVLDADSWGILRTVPILEQLCGRVSRHKDGMALLLVSDPTDERAAECVRRHVERRKKQERVNSERGYEPRSIDWAPRERRSRLASERQRAAAAEPLQVNAASYDLEDCIKILATFVRCCWDGADEDAFAAQAPTIPRKEDRILDDDGLTENDYFFPVTAEAYDQRLEQLILMVTVPLIGKERSFNLLTRFGTIEQIVKQIPARLQEVVQIRETLRKRLLDPWTMERLKHVRSKFELLLSLEDFKGRLKELLASKITSEARTCRRKVRDVIEAIFEEKDHFVSEVVWRLMEYILAPCSLKVTRDPCDPAEC